MKWVAEILATVASKDESAPRRWYPMTAFPEAVATSP